MSCAAADWPGGAVLESTASSLWMELLVINLNRHPASSRRGSARKHPGPLCAVPTCLYGLVQPRKGSPVRVAEIATWTLKWWPHRRQRALYQALEAGALNFWPTANGFEMCKLDEAFDHHYVVVRRDADRILIEGLLNELPVWKRP